MPISPVDDQNPQGDGQHAAEGSAQDSADSASDGGHGRGDTIDAQEPEEIQPHKDLKAPDMPSRAEVAQHRANGHLLYRNWCPDSVEAFGREWPHSAHANGEAHTSHFVRLLVCHAKGRVLEERALGR